MSDDTALVPYTRVDGSDIPDDLKAFVLRLGQTVKYIIDNLAAAPLSDLVKSVVDTFMARDEAFTAYDVTMALRGLFPPKMRYLPHYDQQGYEGVQSEVHRQMAQYVNAGAYRERTTYPNSVDAAREYYATPAGTQPSPNAYHAARATTARQARNPVTPTGGGGRLRQLNPQAWVVSNTNNVPQLTTGIPD